MGLLAEAIALAADVHRDQYDKGGKPYIMHPIRVMQKCEPYGEDCQVVAVLHDVIEDNKSYNEEWLVALIKQLFGPIILTWVEILTRNPGDDYLDVYIPRIINQGDLAMYVKLADLEDNLNILRQPKLNDKAILRLQKYHMAYRMLRDG